MTAAAAAVIADIGASNTRMAMIGPRGERSSPVSYRNERFDSLRHVVGAFLTDHGAVAPVRGAFAVAAPIVGDEVRFTNRGWRFSVQALARELGLERLDVINDFAAQALSLPALREGDSLGIGGGRALRGATRAVLGPGTGLGIAGLVPAGDGWIAVPGEGGHVTLAASDDFEARLIARLRERFGHCSAERVLSGPGLTNLFEVVAAESGAPHEEIWPEDVTRRAAAGDALASRCLALFFAFLGTVAANVALTLGALGGVYLSGGILPRIADALLSSPFRTRFEDKGRYSGYLAAIPTRLITVEYPALLGLQRLLGENGHRAGD
jgi:glucokinase